MAINSLQQQIEYILSLKDGWDGEGSVAPKRKIVAKAKEWVSVMEKFIAEKKGIEIENPKMFPYFDGSIDLHWKNDEYELGCNVSEQGVDYYGDDGKESNEIKGKIEV